MDVFILYNGSPLLLPLLLLVMGSRPARHSASYLKSFRHPRLLLNGLAFNGF